jgi:U6 snRNA-associated Sm-like protein LSm7
MNLVLDDVTEILRGTFVPFEMILSPNRPSDDEGNEAKRTLGLVVARGTLLVLISPTDGSQAIENPYANAE